MLLTRVKFLRNQYCAGFAANATILLCGSCFVWVTPLLPRLSDQAGTSPLVSMTPTQQSWLVALYEVGALAAPIPAGFLADKTGRRVAMLAGMPLLLFSWLAVFSFRSVQGFYAARLLQGTALGFLGTAAGIYISEITSAHARGTMTSLQQGMWYSGFLLQYITGSYLTYDVNVHVNLTLTVALFMYLIIFQQETPYYLVKIGEKERAFKSLMNLRGKTLYDDLTETYGEMSQIVESVEMERNCGKVSASQIVKNIETERNCAKVRAPQIVKNIETEQNCAKIRASQIVNTDRPEQNCAKVDDSTETQILDRVETQQNHTKVRWTDLVKTSADRKILLVTQFLTAARILCGSISVSTYINLLLTNDSQNSLTSSQNLSDSLTRFLTNSSNDSQNLTDGLTRLWPNLTNDPQNLTDGLTRFLINSSTDSQNLTRLLTNSNNSLTDSQNLTNSLTDSQNLPNSFTRFLTNSTNNSQNLTNILTRLLTNSTNSSTDSQNLMNNSTSVTTIIYGTVTLVTIISASFLVDVVGRRVLLLVSSGGAFLANFCCALYFYHPPLLDTTLPLSFLLTGFTFFFSLGLGPVTQTVQSELLPSHTRGLGNVVSLVNVTLTGLVTLRCYQIVVDQIGIYANFVIYAAVCALCFVFVLIFVPETRGKSLLEIRRHFIDEARERIQVTKF
ncbi:uncharacterized protein LOC120355887 [Nilaparvata lugens]|uniref:uncharacterized protein LOC120355887 n=1 Tax=Nilaparvata lugens TaxID=108931 RepID=UPI00193E4AA0|nr:uncharacterized protein LOC120355887 [Nilaparvata lugens]